MKKLILSIFLILLMSLGAEARSINLAGRTINIVIPSGYCELGKHPVDIDLENNTRAAIEKTQNRLLSAFAACNELIELRTGTRETLDNFGQVLVQASNGQPRHFKGITRASFIKKMGQYKDGDLARIVSRVSQRYGESLSLIQEPESLGVLYSDHNGVYWGIMMPVPDEYGLPKLMTGIIAGTIVKELSFSYNLYQKNDADFDLNTLLERQKIIMDLFVRANI